MKWNAFAGILLLLVLCLTCNLDVDKSIEQLPLIKGEIMANKRQCQYLEEINLQVTAEDPNGDVLEYYWICSEGNLLSQQPPP